MHQFAIFTLLPWLANAFSIGSLHEPNTAQKSFLPGITVSKCDCKGTNNTGPSGKPYICHDPRLGPKRLPRKFPLLSFVSDYDRFGALAPGDFLVKWTDPKTGYYNYPPKNGFSLDQSGNPIKGNLTLEVGTTVDRFGSEYGVYYNISNDRCGCR